MRASLLQAAIAIALFAMPATALSQTRLALQLFGGAAWNPEVEMTVRQGNAGEIRERVRFETRPFTQPFYWAVRASLEQRSGAWELQLIHHKLYLVDNPPAIQRFEITHGFNILTLGRAFPLGSGFAARAGLGIVLAHAESEVRGLYEGDAGNLGSGYELTGPALLWGLGWQQPLSRRLFLAAEASVTASRVEVPVAEGSASFWSMSLHGLLGVGFRFGRDPG